MSFDEDSSIRLSSAAVQACGQLVQNITGESHDDVHAISDTVDIAKVIITCSTESNLDLMTNAITTIAWCARKRSTHFPLAFQVGTMDLYLYTVVGFILLHPCLRYTKCPIPIFLCLTLWDQCRIGYSTGSSI